MYVCCCRAVTDKTIDQVIDAGAESVSEVTAACGAGGDCGACQGYIEGMIEKSVFPIASDWGGSFYCYDLRAPLTPLGDPVLRWNHEYSEEPEYQSDVWSEFAPNFVSFIEFGCF